MESRNALFERVRELKERAKEWITQQTWFIQLREKWEELDAQTQQALRIGGVGLGVLAFLVVTLSFVWSVHSTKQEWQDKSDLLAQMQSANDEIRRLRDSNSRAEGSAGQTWTAYAEQLFTQQGIAKESWSIGSERTSDGGEVSLDLAKMSVFEVTLKQINIRQLVKVAFAIENGPRPVRLKQLTIDTQPDASGYLDAVLVLAGYQVGGPTK